MMAENTEINTEPIQITAVKILDDMKMILTFSTDERKLFDAKKLTGPAFEPLKNGRIFENCRIIDGVITWLDETIDCAPEWMYSHSTAINGSRKDNNQAFVLDSQKAGAFLNRQIPTSTDALNRFKKRNEGENKNV